MSGRRTAILVLIVLLLCLVVGALGTLAYMLFIQTAPVEALEERPTILIDSPRHRAELTVGQEVQIFATGRDPARIARMELWVDGELVQSQASALPEGSNPFPLMASWEPPIRGHHTIVVRGYNTAGTSGQASITVNAVEAPEIPQGCEGVALVDHQLQVGDTLEDIAAAYELTVEQLLACNPGLDPVAPLTPEETLQIPVIVSPEPPEPPISPTPVPPAPTPEGPGPLPPPVVAPAPEPEGAPQPPPPELPPATILGFEALEFQVDGAYDEVYCLARLGDAPLERIPQPEGSSFSSLQDNYWDIQAELAGINSRMVSVTGDAFRVEAECFGWMGIDGYSLGHFIREHGEADWTGELLEATAIADDGRWFSVRYRICPDFPCEPLPGPDAPENLTYGHMSWSPPLCTLIRQLTGTELSCPEEPVELHWFTWEWSGDRATIDGFRLYRNDTMLYQIEDPTARSMFVDNVPSEPPCGWVDRYHVTAYHGPAGAGAESASSNSVGFEGPPCPRVVTVALQELHTGCIRALTDPCDDPTCATCRVDDFTLWTRVNDRGVDSHSSCEPPDITSHAVMALHEILYFETISVELALGDDLTIYVLIRASNCECDYDRPPWARATCIDVGRHVLLEGTKTIPWDDLATGDFILELQAPHWLEASGWVTLHLEVMDVSPPRGRI